MLCLNVVHSVSVRCCGNSLLTYCSRSFHCIFVSLFDLDSHLLVSTVDKCPFSMFSVIIMYTLIDSQILPTIVIKF